jgi:hypothetical protein
VEMTAPAPVVKLENPRGWETVEGHDDFVRILEGGQWETFSPESKAYIKPYAERSVEDRKLIDIIMEEADRIVPNKLGVEAAERIKAGKVEGQAGPVEPSGLYIRYREAYPILLFSMEGPNPLGTVRHEAIHHLRNYGFFSKQEWATLETAANSSAG